MPVVNVYALLLPLYVAALIGLWVYEMRRW